MDLSSSYKIISWNVDGYDENTHNYILSLIEKEKYDVIFLSEIKKNEKDFLKFWSENDYGYNIIVNAHSPSKYHGVAMLIKNNHNYEEFEVIMNCAVRKDSKIPEASTGRIIVVCLNTELYIIGSYIPNSGRSDKEKLEYRTKIWDISFLKILELLRQKGHTIWMGDINVALDEIDVSDPPYMKRYAGFTTPERENFKKILDGQNWIDIWRYQNPDKIVYTWKGYNKKENYGMRLDNILISKSLLSDNINAFVIDNPEINIKNISDHIPIGIHIQL